MNLISLLEDLSSFDDDTNTIYVASPWSPDAHAIIINLRLDGIEPIIQNGKSFEYFLEAFIAREFLADFTESQAGMSATNIERCERLIRYAETDA